MAAPSSCTSVSFAEEHNPACRPTMEDEHIIMDGFGGVADQGLYAVFDGHGGRGIVDFVKKHFAPILTRELSRAGSSAPSGENARGAGNSGGGSIFPWESGSAAACSSSSSSSSGCGGGGHSDEVGERLARAFIATDLQSHQAGIMASGCTAAVALVRRCPRTGQRVLHAANVGDSRAVLCEGGKALRVSYDHKANDAHEKARIEGAGGFVLKGRVCGILAVARALGDHSLKRFVSAVPYTSATPLRDSAAHPFFIVACDGVWDVMSDQEAVDIVARARTEEEKRQASQWLIDEAMKRESTDNITAMVVYL